MRGERAERQEEYSGRKVDEINVLDGFYGLNDIDTTAALIKAFNSFHSHYLPTQHETQFLIRRG